MAENDYVLKDTFDEYKESTKEKIGEMKERENKCFELIFEKLEEIRDGQITTSEHIKNLNTRLEDAIDKDDFNSLFDIRVKFQGILNKEKLDLRFVEELTRELKDEDGNPKYAPKGDYIENNDKYENLMKIHWLGSGFAKWLFFIASGILTLIALFSALAG